MVGGERERGATGATGTSPRMRYLWRLRRKGGAVSRRRRRCLRLRVLALHCAGWAAPLCALCPCVWEPSKASHGVSTPVFCFQVLFFLKNMDPHNTYVHSFL
jgi:hypothetical protein